MAGPKVFVPGPGVNPNIGSPAQYMQNLQRMSDSFAVQNYRRQALEQDRIFKEQQQELLERKQTFDEGADARKRAEAEYQQRLNNQRALRGLEVFNTAPYATQADFLSDPRTQKLFTQAGITDIGDQESKFMEWAKKNPTLSRDPTAFYDYNYEQALRQGDTQEQATAKAQNAVGRIFKTWSPELAGKLLDTGATGGMAGLMGKIFGGSGKAGTPVQGVPNIQDQEEFLKLVSGQIGVEDARGGGVLNTVANWFGVGDPTRDLFDVGARDLDNADIQRLVGRFSDKYSQYAMAGALRSISNPEDGTVNQKVWRNILDNPTSQDAIDFEKAMQAEQANAERTRASQYLQGLSLQDTLGLASLLQGQRNAYNMDIVRRTSPQAATFEDRLGSFRNYLGIPTAAAAPASQQGPIINTGQTQNQTQNPDATSTGSATLDNLINQAGVANATPRDVGVPGNDNRLFVEGESGPEAAVKAPFRLFNQAAENLFELSGAQGLTQRILDNTIGQSDLSPGARPPNEVADALGTEFEQWDSTQTPLSEPKKEEAINNAMSEVLESWDSPVNSRQRSNALWDITGTGPARASWQKRFVNTPAKAKAYAKAFSQFTSETEAIRIIRALQRGETPKVD